jgi:hypothetical protein
MTPGQGRARRTGPPSSPPAHGRRRGRARSPLPPPVRLTSLRPPVNVGPLPDPRSSKTGDRLGEVGESGHTNRVSAGRAKKLGNLRKTQKVSALGCHSVYDGVTKAGPLVLCPTPAILLLAAPVREKQEPFSEEPGLPPAASAARSISRRKTPAEFRRGGPSEGPNRGLGAGTSY